MQSRWNWAARRVPEKKLRFPANRLTRPASIPVCGGITGVNDTPLHPLRQRSYAMSASVLNRGLEAKAASRLAEKLSVALRYPLHL